MKLDTTETLPKKGIFQKLAGFVFSFFGIFLILGIVGGSMLVFTQNTGPAMIQVGELAPDFQLQSVWTNQEFKLSEHRGQHNILLYFQEGIMCPPCWQQMRDMEMKLPEFNALNVKSVMISVDGPRQMNEYAKTWGLREELLADTSLQVSRMYNTLEDSMHPGQRPGHVFVLVDTTGKIKWYKSVYKPTQSNGHHSEGGAMYMDVREILVEIQNALQV